MTDEISEQRGDEGRGRDVTALVVLLPAGGHRRDDDARRDIAPSRADLDRIAPSELAVETVADEFRRMGFDVGPFGGIAMAVTAPIGHVESTFEISIPEGAGEVAGASDATGDGDVELPLAALDPAVAALVDRIVIEPPAELHDGPTWTP